MKNNGEALTLQNLHARMIVDLIHKQAEKYIGTYIDKDENMGRIEAQLRQISCNLVQKIDREATVDVKMPRLNEGGRNGYLTITTRHPEKFGITLLTE